MHVVIMGAGPAGLAAALALHQQSTPSSPISITILELRPSIQTLGGAVNLTPLAMRYLDALGVGARLRPHGAKVPFIEMLSHRTGASLGKLWPDVDALRVLRQTLVEALTQTVLAIPSITLRYNAKITSLVPSADNSSITIHLSPTDSLTADVLLGCDGIHSQLRTTYVDPARHKTYSGRATAYAYLPVSVPGDAGIVTSTNSPAVDTSSLVTASLGSLLVTFFEPAREKLYLAAVVERELEEEEGSGGRAVGKEEGEVLRRDFLRRFKGGRLKGLEGVVERCEEWTAFPVYMLPPGGVWARGRALLMGDAAHAVSSIILFDIVLLGVWMLT